MSRSNGPAYQCNRRNCFKAGPYNPYSTGVNLHASPALKTHAVPTTDASAAGQHQARAQAVAVAAHHLMSRAVQIDT